MKPAEPCPCGSGKAFAHCCAPLLAGAAAADAEALMRSRYTAYVLGDEAYLLATWHPDTRPEHLDLAADGAVRWLGLSVREHARSGDDTAEVAFTARYRVAGRGHRLTERSRFMRQDGRWFYVDGDMQDVA